MDLKLFTDQLNQILSSNDMSDWLEEVCGLLRVHTEAGVKLNDMLDLLPGESMKHADPAAQYSDKHEYIINDLKLYHMKEPPDAETRLAASIVSAVCTVILRQAAERETESRKKRLEAVRGVINSLSFSELEAAVHICQALNGGEGLLVAGHIADKLGFTRSVVVNALRKLESAGAAETRSLGMKGTYIRIKDKLLAEELGKLR